MGTCALLHGDALLLLATLSADSIDAVITDPPYELGFMAKAWDGSGIAYNTDLWRAVLRVAKPGAHLLAFGGTRTYHRMTCAIEDAGWEIRDSLHWLYATGFPKSLDVGGGRGTALKPAHEPIVLARKPLVGSVADTVQQYGTGALNIDAARIVVEGSSQTSNGRWPANVLVSCCGEYPHRDGCPVAELDRQSGITSQQPRVFQRNGVRASDGWGLKATSQGVVHGDTGGASRFFFVAKPSGAERDRGIGTPAQSPAELTGRVAGSAGLNSPRASQRATRRNVHPTVKPLELMHYLVRLITPPGGTVLDPFCGSGTTLIAAASEGCSVIGMDLDATYLELARQRLGLFALEERDPAERTSDD